MTSFRALIVRDAALATMLPLAALTLFLLRDQDQAGREALDRSLLIATTTASSLLADLPDGRLQAEIRKLDRGLEVRLTVIRQDGTVIADTHADPSRMANHAGRSEVSEALLNGLGKAEHHSATLGREMRYLAIRHPSAGGLRVYRAAGPLAQLESRIRRTQLTLSAVAVAVLIFSLLLSARLVRQIAAPVEALSRAAVRYAEGDSDVRVIPDGPGALQRLARAFNDMVERLNSHVRNLDEAQGYLDAVIRQMPDGLLVLDSRGTVTRANEAAQSLLGLQQERMLGRPILGVLLSYALDREVNQVLQGGRGGNVDVRAPDGRSLRVAVGPLEVGGQPAGAVVILQDVSELRRADDMRRDFVANVSHELRTPIASIRALAETLALRSGKRPELVPEYVPRMVQECERVDRLVEDLLLLAQTEAGQLRLAPEPLDPREAAEEVARQVEPLAAAAGTGVELDPFDGARLVADRSALQQCIRNLVDNALRYAPGGTVRIGGRLRDDQVVLHVADDGPGIPPEDLPRIFERFYQVDKARSRDGATAKGGSGLGLSIVRHLAEAQGGRAWAESRLGEGSTFYLAFPRA